MLPFSPAARARLDQALPDFGLTHGGAAHRFLQYLIGTGAIQSSVPVGNTCFVDAVNGNDSTAHRGNLGSPFLTVQAAATDSQAGDVVSIGPGTFTENVVVPQRAGSLSFRGASPASTFIRAPASGPTVNDPAVSLTLTNGDMQQFLLQNLTVQKPVGTGPAVLIDGTGFAAPGTALPGGLIMNLSNVQNDVGNEAIRATCIGALFSVFAFLNGRVTLREVGLAFLFSGICQQLTARFSEAQPMPGSGRSGINIFSVFGSQVDLEEQVSIQIDNTCNFPQVNGLLRVGPTMGPVVHLHGSHETQVALDMLAASGPGTAPDLDLRLSFLGTVNLSGVDATTYDLNLDGALLPNSGTILVAGASDWDISANASNLSLPLSGGPLPAGCTLDRDEQTTEIVLPAASTDIPLGTGLLSDVPPFPLQPKVLVSPADNAVFAAFANVPSATMIAMNTVRVKGAAGATVTLQFVRQ